MYKVLLTDDICDAALDVMNRHQEIEAVRTTTLAEAELARMIPGYHALIVRSSTKVTAKVIAAADRLKFIGRAGVGYDNIDIAAATGRGILVMNSPTGNIISTAEHTIGLIFALLRRIPEAHMTLRNGLWERNRLRGSELYGKTVGIIGLGRVGRELAARLRAFSVRLLAVDPRALETEAASLGVALVDLDTLLQESDVITLHTPLDASTRSLISTHEFAKMREGVYLINCARGGVVNEAALSDALESGRVAGAALDVFEQEPPLQDRLLQNDRVVATPHIGGATVEAQTRVAVVIAEVVANALLTGNVRFAVNDIPRAG